MIVKAIEKGFFGNLIREKGSQFEVPDNTKPATWFVPVEQPKTEIEQPEIENDSVIESKDEKKSSPKGKKAKAKS
tara:strand:- start:289 stop:513 length:225 start_codon:yes stop_codon:yes gene_type:complete